MAKKDEAETVRLKDVVTGAVVEVTVEKAERMGSGWEPVTASKAAAKKAS